MKFYRVELSKKAVEPGHSKWYRTEWLTNIGEAKKVLKSFLDLNKGYEPNGEIETVHFEPTKNGIRDLLNR